MDSTVGQMKQTSLKVGFEIEFIGVSVEKTADLIAHLLDGEISKLHKNAINVDTELGTFRVKVDAQLLEKLAKESAENIKQNKIDLEGIARDALAPLLQTFVPNEIVCPPISRSKISELEPLVTALRKAGAKGTSVSLSYAFGLHINPEVISFDPESILAHLRAFVLLYDWLYKDMMFDKTRMLSMFAKGYSSAYCQFILRQDYKPLLKDLIYDYIKFVPSRNYALDCYPLFLYLDPKAITSKVKDPLIKPRPTFHFRMPNCLINDPSWSLKSQWRYWLMVENLAAQPSLLRAMAHDYLILKEGWLDLFSQKWKKKVDEHYLGQL